MTDLELQELAGKVLSVLRENGLTIDQLAQTNVLGNNDFIELNKGRKVSLEDLRNFIRGVGTYLEIIRKEDKIAPTDQNVFSALRTLDEILKNSEELKKIFIRKDQPDFTNFLVQFFAGLEVGTYKEGKSGAKIDKLGNAEIGSLITRLRAILAELKVLGDSEFDGNLSSKDFISGFTSGKGWAIFIKEVLNALGVPEHKAVMELDDLIVRGTLRVFEFIVSQMLGENDNRTFTGMMEVDHYDPETGKVWLQTQDGKLYNPFRKDDYIMVQQYNGMPSEENNHYVTKHYELIITGAGVGELAECDKPEDRLDWVTFKNFTCDMEGGSVDLITKGDTFVRVDNATDPDRKGIIQLMTVGNTTPYMDIIYGLKTDPDNALKGRFGNLQGIYHHLFGWLKEFGAYLINLYAVGVFRLRNTGEDLETKFDILQNQFSTSYQKLKLEVTDEDNFLKNATFTENLDGWQSENDIRFLTDGNKAIYVNRSLYTLKNKVAGIERYDNQNMLRLVNSFVRQANADIRKPGTHKEYKKNADGSLSEFYTEVPDTLYMSVKFICRRSGMLTIGFKGAGNAVGALPYVSMMIEESFEYKTLQWSGTWDGKGDFNIEFTGDLYISMLSVTTHPLDDYKIELSTRFEQSAERIAMLGTRIDKVNDTVTDLGIELSSQAERIKLWADKTDNINVTVTQLGVELNAAKGELSLWANKTDVLNKTVTELGVDLNSTKGKLDLYVNKTDTINGTVTQLGIDMDAAEKAIALNASNITSAKSDIAGLKVRADEISSSVTSVRGLVGDAQSTADSAYSIANSARTLADKAMYTGAYGSEEYSQSSNPWSSWPGGTEYKHVGAIWYDTSTGTTKRYEGFDNSNTWVTISNSAYASSSYVLQNKDKWSMVVANFDSNGKPTSASGLVTTATGSSLYASRSEYSALSVEVNRHEAFINVNSDNIQQIVRKDGIISAINQSAERFSIDASKIDINGVTTINNSFIVETNGTTHIGGFVVSGNGLTNMDSNGNFTNDAYVIFRNDSHGCFAGIGGNILPAVSGARGVARFENHDSSDWLGMGETNYAQIVSARNAKHNVAIQMNGGYISGLAVKTQNVVSSCTIDRYATSIACINNSEITITLPTMQAYDDGHVIKIKNMNGKRVYIKPGYGYQIEYNSITGKYTTTYKATYMHADQGRHFTQSDPNWLDSNGDAAEYIYHRDLNNGTQYGCWVEYKHPRDW